MPAFITKYWISVDDGADDSVKVVVVWGKEIVGLDGVDVHKVCRERSDPISDYHHHESAVID